MKRSGMSNDECRMTKFDAAVIRHPSAFVIRHSVFVILPHVAL